MKDSIELAVVVPTFNERDNVHELVRLLDQALDGIAFEIAFVDDDSPDGTADAVRELARSDRRVRVIQRVNRRGLSSACVEGMLATSAPYVAVIDADLQHDERLLPVMLDRLKREQLDLVIGTRHAEGGSMGGFAQWRVRLSDAGKRLSRMITRADLSDPMSGFFVVDRRYLNEVVRSLSAIGFKILVDLVASSRRPVRFAEVPYHFRDRVRGESKLDVLVGVEYLLLVADKIFGTWIPPRFVLFAMVGAFGALLHLSVLWLMLKLGNQPFLIAQSIAALLVMTSNFFLDNALTWRDYRLRGRSAFIGLLKFYVACSIGAFVNIQVATVAVKHGAPWYLAGVAGLIVGSVWNYAVTAATTWKRRRRHSAHR